MYTYMVSSYVDKFEKVDILKCHRQGLTGGYFECAVRSYVEREKRESSREIGEERREKRERGERERARTHHPSIIRWINYRPPAHTSHPPVRHTTPLKRHVQPRHISHTRGLRVPVYDRGYHARTYDTVRANICTAEARLNGHTWAHVCGVVWCGAVWRDVVWCGVATGGRRP